MAKITKADLFDALAARSNIVELCGTFGIERQAMLQLVEENPFRLKIANRKIETNEKSMKLRKSLASAKGNIVKEIKTEISKDERVSKLLAIIDCGSLIAEELANQIIKQLDNMNENQGTLNWIFCRKCISAVFAL